MEEQQNTLGVVERVDPQAILERVQISLQDLSRLLEDPEAQHNALEALALGDTIAIQHLKMTRGDAPDYWRSLSWEEKHSFLRGLGDSAAAEIVVLLDGIQGNSLVRTLLKTAMDLVREAEVASSRGFQGLIPLYQELLSQGVIKERGPNSDTLKVWMRGRGDVFLSPNTPSARATWPFLQKIHQRVEQARKESRAKRDEKAKRWAEKTPELRAETTPGLTFLAIVEEGQTGNLLVEFPGKRAALLEFSDVFPRETARVRILKANYSGLVWDSILVSLVDFKALRGKWPNDFYGWREGLPEDIPYGYQKILQEKLQAERRVAQHRERLAPVTSLATLPIPLGEQGLTRLLQGENIGVVALWLNRFKWRYDGKDTREGLVALAIERQSEELPPGERLQILEVISDHSFLGHLRGESIPKVILEERKNSSPRVRYAEQFPDLAEETRNALTAVRVAMQLRLDAEHRASTGESTPEERNNHNG